MDSLDEDSFAREASASARLFAAAALGEMSLSHRRRVVERARVVDAGLETYLYTDSLQVQLLADHRRGCNAFAIA